MNNTAYIAAILNDRNSIKDMPNYNMKYTSGAGLCNQLWNLVYYIIQCYQTGAEICVVDCFLYCMFSGGICPLSTILNYDALTEACEAILGERIIFVDRTDYKVEVVEAIYGIPSNYIDLTDKMKNLDQWRGVSFEKIDHDPMVGIFKKLKVTYKIGGNIRSESLVTPYTYNWKAIEKKFDRSYIMTGSSVFNKELFSMILVAVVKTAVIPVQQSGMETMKAQWTLHAKVEHDAITHFAKLYKTDYINMKRTMYDQLKYAINSQCKDKTTILVLCASSDSNEEVKKIVSGGIHDCIFMNTENKNKICAEYNIPAGRETFALIDLILALNTKNFIGVFDYKRDVGSSFSHTISQYLMTNVPDSKQVLIPNFQLEEDDTPQLQYVNGPTLVWGGGV